METLLEPTLTKANKNHACDFCGEKIIIGEKYLKSTHKFDGDIYNWKTHIYCAEIAARLKMYDEADEGVTSDYFIERISDEHYFILSKSFTEEEANKFSNILSQLHYVRFREKLWFVIRHYKKLDAISNNQFLPYTKYW